MITKSSIIRLDHDALFAAFREFIANHVEGVKAEDVCNFHIEYDKDNSRNTTVVVQLQEIQI